jgi:hypothetical protein
MDVQKTVIEGCGVEVRMEKTLCGVSGAKILILNASATGADEPIFRGNVRVTIERFI